MTLPKEWDRIPPGEFLYAARAGDVLLAIGQRPGPWDRTTDPDVVAVEVETRFLSLGATRAEVDATTLRGLPTVRFRLEWGRTRVVAGWYLPTASGGVLHPFCEWDPTTAKKKHVQACLAAIETVGGVAAPPEAPLPFTPPSGFGRGLGLGLDAAPPGERYWFLDPHGAQVAYFRAEGVLLDAPADADVVSRLTDEVSRMGVQVKQLTVEKISDVKVFRYVGLQATPAGPMAVLGYFMPRGAETVLLFGVVPAPELGPYEAAFDAAARSVKGLAPPPPGTRNARTYEAAERRAPPPSPAPRRAATGGGGAGPVTWGIVAVAVATAALLGWWLAAGRERARRRRREEALGRARHGG